MSSSECSKASTTSRAVIELPAIVFWENLALQERVKIANIRVDIKLCSAIKIGPIVRASLCIMESMKIVNSDMLPKVVIIVTGLLF